MKEILYLFVGWVMGLASPIIVSHIQDRKQRREFMASARVELRDLQFILASTGFLLTLKYGHVTVALVQLVAKVTDNYVGNEPIEGARKALEGLRGLSQEQLDQAASVMPRDPLKGSSLKLIQPRYVISNLGELSKLKPALQLRFHELLRTLDAINQEVPKIEALILMTFESSISEKNHNAIHADIRGRYIFIAGQCERMVEKIEAIITHDCA